MYALKLALDPVSWIVYFVYLGWKIPSLGDFVLTYWVPFVFFGVIVAAVSRFLTHKKTM
jgi:hypothetical protein